MSGPKKVVLAYSGGLDTSIILKWLQTEYRCEVVTFTADLGQGEELEPARKKAELLGIKEIYIEDVREEFVRDFVFPMFRANAVYEGLYLLGTSIARPLISKRLVEIAAETGADAGEEVAKSDEAAAEEPTEPVAAEEPAEAEEKPAKKPRRSRKKAKADEEPAKDEASAEAEEPAPAPKAEPEPAPEPEAEAKGEAASAEDADSHVAVEPDTPKKEGPRRRGWWSRGK